MGKNLIKSVAVLTAICVVSGILLALANVFLKVVPSTDINPEVASHMLGLAPDAAELGAVNFEHDNEYVVNIVRVVGGEHNDSFIFRAYGSGGYSKKTDASEVLTMVKDGTITGVFIFRVATEENRYDTHLKAHKDLIENWFVGKTSIDPSPNGKAIAGEIPGATGAASATIIAFAEGVRASLLFYNENKADLLSADFTPIEGVEAATNWIIKNGEFKASHIAALKTAGYSKIDDDTVTIPHASWDYEPQEGDNEDTLKAAVNEHRAKVWGVFTLKDRRNNQLVVGIDGENLVAVEYSVLGKVKETVIAGASTQDALNNAKWYHDKFESVYPAPNFLLENEMTAEQRTKLIANGYTATVLDALTSFRFDFAPEATTLAAYKTALQALFDFEADIYAVFQGATNIFIVANSGTAQVIAEYNSVDNTAAVKTTTVTGEGANVTQAIADAQSYFAANKTSLFGKPKVTWAAPNAAQTTRLAAFGYTGVTTVTIEVDTSAIGDTIRGQIDAAWKASNGNILVLVSQTSGSSYPSKVTLLVEFNATAIQKIYGFGGQVNESHDGGEDVYHNKLNTGTLDFSQFITSTPSEAQVDAVVGGSGDSFPFSVIDGIAKAKAFFAAHGAKFFAA